MPTVTLGVDEDVATRDDGLAAGAGPHLPVGYWSGVRYRSAMRFIPPAGWTGWTSITKATLTFYISDHNHVGVRNSSMYVRRVSTADVWVKGAGGQSCDGGFTAANNTQYDDLAAVSSNQAGFSSGSTANAVKSFGVTAMVRDYHGAGITHIVFVFDPVGSGDYTELWADEKSGYTATLEIEYVDASPPSAPTLVSPTAGEAVGSQTPTFDWTHVDPNADPQLNAEVQLYDAAGAAIGSPWAVAGSTSVLVSPSTLTRGTTYQFAVRTQDVTGWGPFSAKRTFSIKSLPVVTIDPTRRMEFALGAPRLRVNWTCDQAQTHYRIQTTTPTSDTGWVASTVQSVLLTAVALTSGVSVGVNVSVRSDPLPLEGFDSDSFTPRYGLTTHHKAIASPINWGTPTAVATIPLDCQLVFEYGSHPSSTTAPTAWYSSLSAVPKAAHLFWRAWFIPSATQGPTLDKLTIPADSTVTLVDKWGTTRDTPGLSGVWAIAPDEFVYGTRSMTADISGAGPFKVYSYGIQVRAGRSYILTGLMKSNGNSGAHFRLEDGAGNVLEGGGIVLPVGPVQSDVLTGDLDWFATETRDVNRYKTVVWEAPNDMTVYVVLACGGSSGAKAWWDAIKLEESSVATPWSPGAIGATVIDAGGVQIDAARGGIFRYKGSAGGARDTVEGGPNGLLFGGDVNLYSPAANVLKTDDALQAAGLAIGVEKVARFVPIASNTVASGTRTSSFAETDLEITAVPATGVVAVQGYIRTRVNDTSAAEYIAYNYDGTSVAVVTCTGVANRYANSGFMAATGGANNRTIKHSATWVSGSQLYAMVITGYWTTE